MSGRVIAVIADCASAPFPKSKVQEKLQVPWCGRQTGHVGNLQVLNVSSAKQSLFTEVDRIREHWVPLSGLN